MRKRTVFGSIQSKGNDFDQAELRFELTTVSFTLDTVFLKDAGIFKTDDDGIFRAELWCDDDGLRSTDYIVYLPDSATGKPSDANGLTFSLPYGDGSDVPLGTLLALSNQDNCWNPNVDGSNEFVETITRLISAFSDELGSHTQSIASPTILGHVKIDGTSITIDENAVISAKTARFLQTQPVESNVWLVNHNLGFTPNCEIRGINGNVVDAEIQHISENQLRVFFAVPQRGSISCI